MVINATDMTTGSLFPFIQLQFDLLCADLSNFKIAYAVAASAAYPVVLPALTLTNHRSSKSSCLKEALEPELDKKLEDKRRLVINQEKQLEIARGLMKIRQHNLLEANNSLREGKDALITANERLRAGKTGLARASQEVAIMLADLKAAQEKVHELARDLNEAREEEERREQKRHQELTIETKKDKERKQAVELALEKIKELEHQLQGVQETAKEQITLGRIYDKFRRLIRGEDSERTTVEAPRDEEIVQPEEPTTLQLQSAKPAEAIEKTQTQDQLSPVARAFGSFVTFLESLLPNDQAQEATTELEPVSQTEHKQDNEHSEGSTSLPGQEKLSQVALDEPTELILGLSQAKKLLAELEQRYAQSVVKIQQAGQLPGSEEESCPTSKE